MQTNILRYSPITYILERTFFVLQFTSPANILFRTRRGAQHRCGLSDDALEDVTRRRGRLVDLYVLLWSAIEFACASSTANTLNAPTAAVVLPAFRAFEIFQASINMSIFDRLRTDLKRDRVSSVARTLLLSCWNFLELMVCFGIVYAGLADHLEGIDTWYDPFYFSVITQLTVGFGDVRPLGPARLVAATQGVVGFLVAVLMISRFVSIMPSMKSVMGDDDN